MQVNWETYKKAIKGSMFNVIVMTLLFQQVTYRLVMLSSVDFGPELPSLPTTLWHLFISVVVVEIGFYYSHRYIQYRHTYMYILLYTSYLLLNAALN